MEACAAVAVIMASGVYCLHNGERKFVISFIMNKFVISFIMNVMSNAIGKLKRA